MATREDLMAALKGLILPAIGKSIVDLGFVKRAEMDAEGKAQVQIELRAPHHKNKEWIEAQAFERLHAVPGVTTVQLAVTQAQSQAQAQAAGPAEQDLELLKNVRHILAVSSGKGGVGKSTVTANLAAALARQGLKVGILDADIYGPSMNLMFGVKEDPNVNEDRTVFPVVVQDGIRIISMAMFSEADKAVIWRGPMASQMIRNFLTRVHWGRLDVLLLDMPPGTGDIQLTITQMAPLRGSLIVTTPQEVSVLDARKGLRMFESVKVPVLGIVENMSYFICDQCTKHHYIFRSGGGETVARELGVPFLGEIPLESAVADGGDEGVPVTQSRKGAQTPIVFDALARNVWELLEDLEANDSALPPFDMAFEDLPVEEV
jgi:ATP-binding protein involved in chromosome partitioning